MRVQLSFQCCEVQKPYKNASKRWKVKYILNLFIRKKPHKNESSPKWRTHEGVDFGRIPNQMTPILSAAAENFERTSPERVENHNFREI